MSGPEGRQLEEIRGLILSGRTAAALERAQRGVQRWPASGPLHQVLADLLSTTGAAERAQFHYERAVALGPRSAALLGNYGWVLSGRGEHARGVALLKEAVGVDAGYAPAARNLVVALLAARKTGEAVEAGIAGVARFPSDVLLSANLANAMLSAGMAQEAVAELRRVMGAAGASVGVQTTLAFAMNYWEGATPEGLLEVHAELGRLLDASFPVRPAATTVTRDAERPLNVAYLSQDFRNRSAAHFIEPFLTHHDRSLFRACCYSETVEVDEMTARLRGLAGSWTDVSGLAAADLARKLAEDRIDVAVDLAGHTCPKLVNALRARPAPVQVSYLGYPNTTGVAQIGFRFVDAVTDPPGRDFATERLVRLPGCFLCYSPPPHAPAFEATPPSGAGRPVTFGSFNTNAKLSPGTLDLWARILNAVPGSRLLLKNFDLGDESVTGMMRERFLARGVGPERLELTGETASKRDHMAMYGRVDIALDPFPYNGTTTTAEALWMGVPVVSMPGDRHLSRVGASLLAAAGLGELCADGPESYVRIAAELAKDGGRLAVLRRGLRERVASSALCDGRAFTRGLEAEYRGLWRAWCAGA